MLKRLRSLPFVAGAAFLLFCNATPFASTIQGQVQYVCAPCGCSKDKDVFNKPGKCPACGMELVIKGSMGARVDDPVDHEPVDEAHDRAVTTERKVTKLAPAVYTIRHEDAADGFPQSNTTVVIGKRAVLVVDSCYSPASAKKDIEQIRKWTSKPVKYLLNTHWHMDHTFGNGVYASSFPGLVILAHEETKAQMKGYNSPYLRRYGERNKVLQSMIETGKSETGTPLNEGDVAGFKTQLANREKVWTEFKSLTCPLPTRTFTTGVDLDLGGEKAMIRFLGRGNTAGDVVMYLPKERILATGDLLDSPVPYLGGGFPHEQIATLQKMNAMPAKVFVPGHGAVLHSKAFLQSLIEFEKIVVARVQEEVYKLGNGSGNLDKVQQAVQKSIDMEKWRTRFAGKNQTDRDFFDSFSFPGLVKAAYAETWRK